MGKDRQAVGENAEWVIMLDRDDYNVDLQYRYQEENTDPQVEKTPEAYGTADRIPDQSHL